MDCGKFAFQSYRHAAEVAGRQNSRRRYHGKSTHKVSVYHCILCNALHLTGNNN